MRTAPFPHQQTAFDAGVGRRSFGYWLDPGLGKSKIVLDLIAHHYLNGAIDAAVVIAPNGVHQAWIEDELCKHLDVEVLVDTDDVMYNSRERGKAVDVKPIWQRFKSYDGLVLLAMSYSAARTDRGGKLLRTVLDKRRAAMTLDESTKIKSPGAKITQRMLAYSKYAEFRYALTGTPVTNSPFDLYSQLKFLDGDVWGDRNYADFKMDYGVWETIYKGEKSYPKCVGYKNTDELYAEFHRLGLRMRKEDVIDLPEKVYNRRYFEMTEEQRRLLKEMADELRAQVRGEMVTTPFAIQQLTKAQQIVAGYVKTDSGKVHMLRENPRMECFRELAEELWEPTIIWAKHVPEVDMLCKELGNRCVRYDGKVNNEDRRTAVERFRAGDVQFFVANPAALSFGLTLNVAARAVYYSTSFKLEQRLQSEARCHRIGQTRTVLYTDIVGRRSVDQRILTALQAGRNVAAEITGDELANWFDPS